MYTSEMARAFRSLDAHAPKGFSVSLEDNDNFITVRASEEKFMSLTGEDKQRAVEYMIRVKKALEDNGAIVLLIREGGKEA
jgi:hypothetical protein